MCSPTARREWQPLPLLEGTDGRVYYLRYTPELDEARSRGDLTTNSFVVITKTVDVERRRRIVVANLGEAYAILQDREHFRSLARRLLQRGVCPFDDEQWGGWLGKYHETLLETMLDLEDVRIRQRSRAFELER